MTRACALLLVAHAALYAQPAGQALRAWFPDGTGLEIYSQGTNANRPASLGLIGIGPGIGRQDLVNRTVVDSGNNILFVYNLEAARGATPDTVDIRIEPVSAATEAVMLRSRSVSGGRLPTVAAVRKFPSVKIGEAVTLDILYNPSTGEKIYDVIRPITDPSPSGGPVVTGNKPRQTVSLKEISVEVNGRNLPAPASWMIGAAIRIDIPGHGAWVVSAYNPGNAFQAVGRANGKTLAWTMDRDQVTITSSTGVLTQAAEGVVWVFHQPQYLLQDQATAVRLQAADTVEWLMPGK
jgi:hypothetical protein